MEGHAGHTMTDMSTHQHNMPDHDMPASCSMNVKYNPKLPLFKTKVLTIYVRCCLTGK